MMEETVDRFCENGVKLECISMADCNEIEGQRLTGRTRGRSRESSLERLTRLQLNAARVAAARARETSSERRERLRANAARVAAARARETPLQRKERLRANAARVAAARARETPLQRLMRLHANVTRTAEARARESTFDKGVRLRSNAERAAAARAREGSVERRRRSRTNAARRAAARSQEVALQRAIEEEFYTYREPAVNIELFSNPCSLNSFEEELEGIQERYVQALRSFLQHTAPHHPTRLHDLFARIPEIQAAAALLLESKMFYVPFVLNSAEVR